MNDDGQLRAARLILDYESLSRSFLDVGNTIRANDYRLARIDEYSCIQTPAPVVTYVEDSSDNEAEEMASKSGKSLRELMKGRNIASTPQKAHKSKPPVNPPPPPP